MRMTGPPVSRQEDAVTSETYRRTTVSVSDPECPLPDVPLIVEDLLMEAKQLADANARNDALEEILEHVAALREGRG